MNGFGFVEYADPMDARDVVPGKPLLAPTPDQPYLACLLGKQWLTNNFVTASLPYVKHPRWTAPCLPNRPFPVRKLILVKDGTEFMGERLTVQFARGSRNREPGPPGFGAHGERAPPRPRRTAHRMQITGLPTDTSWQVCLSPTSFPAD